MGRKYKIPKKECYACGKFFDPDMGEGVIISEGEYLLYFCEKCSLKNEHVKYTKKCKTKNN